MTIKFNRSDNSINFGDYKLVFTDDGFVFNGVITARDGFLGDFASTVPTAPTAPSSPLYGTVSGYVSGGITPTTANYNIIENFPFSADASSSDVGDLFQSRYLSAGQSSDVSGYNAGGFLNPGLTDTIDKYPFSSGGNATDVGNLFQGRGALSGQSSTASGYSSGGLTVNTVDKFPFSTDANASDVGNLTVSRADRKS